MGGYTGEVADFTATHKKLFETNNSVTSELKKLRGNMEGTASVWEGQAAVSFRNLMNNFDRRAGDLNDALAAIADLLEQAGSKYQAREEEEEYEMSSINKGLDS